MKTYSMKASERNNQWFIIDATDMVLGRLSSVIAGRLMGKHKVDYTPTMLCGDNIIVINADKIKLTGNNKAKKNIFYWHTGHPGGIKQKTWEEIINGKFPDRLLRNTVRRMLPKNKLARHQLNMLHIYMGDTHNHEAQKPEKLDLQINKR